MHPQPKDASLLHRHGLAWRTARALALVGLCAWAGSACSHRDAPGGDGGAGAAPTANSAGAPAQAGDAAAQAAAGNSVAANPGTGGPSAGSAGGAGAATPAAMPAGFRLGGDAVRGRQVYAANCATCHGDRGDGRGEAAGALDPKPTNFTNAAVMHARSDWDLYHIIRDGGPAGGLSAGMVGYGPMLTDGDLRSVAAFVRTFAGPGAAAPPS
jgi:mono/diheme cytochrome c family protein